MDMAELPVVVMSGSSVFTSKISDEVVGASSSSIINGSLIAYQINVKFGSTICIYIIIYSILRHIYEIIHKTMQEHFTLYHPIYMQTNAQDICKLMRI